MDGDSKKDTVWGGRGGHPSLPQLLQLPIVPFQLPHCHSVTSPVANSCPSPSSHPATRPSPPSAPALEVEGLSFTHNLPCLTSHPTKGLSLEDSLVLSSTRSSVSSSRGTV